MKRRYLSLNVFAYIDVIDNTYISILYSYFHLFLQVSWVSHIKYNLVIDKEVLFLLSMMNHFTMFKRHDTVSEIHLNNVSRPSQFTNLDLYTMGLSTRLNPFI